MGSNNKLHNSSCAMNYCTSITTMLVVPLVYILQCYILHNAIYLSSYIFIWLYIYIVIYLYSYIFI